jgi:HEAT repeat protein
VTSTDALVVARRGLGDDRINAVAEAVRLVGHFGLTELIPAVEILLDRGCPMRVLKAAVSCVGRLRVAGALGGISALSDYPHPMLRRAVMEAAGRIEVGATPVLLRGLGDEAWQVRMDAAIGLGAQRGEAVFAALVRSIEVEIHPRTAEMMVRSVAELKNEDAFGAMAGWLGDTRRPPEVRRAAARGLGERGEYSPALDRAVHSERADVAEQARWALRRIDAQASCFDGSAVS